MNAPDLPQIHRPPVISSDHVGTLVHYHEGLQPVRAALVGHVHEDGRTVDLVVLMDGDARSSEARDAWARGHGVVRARIAIPCQFDDPAGVRHWRPKPQTIVLPLV